MKKVGKINALVVVGMFACMMLTPSVMASPGEGGELPFWGTEGNEAGKKDVLGTTNERDLRIITNGEQRMVITSDGNVGIGTTSPSGKLEVVGNIVVSGTVDGVDISEAYAELLAMDDDLWDAIAAEEAARIAADEALQAAINSEIAARIAADAAEASARQAADEALQAAIDAEAAARESADTALQAAIDAEASARMAADTVLQQNIDDEAIARAVGDAVLQGALEAETANRIAGDNALQAALDAEEAAREAADLALQAAIDAEKAARITADAALQTELDALEAEDALDYDSLADLETAMANGVNLAKTSGSVGIGTDSPQAKLDVRVDYGEGPAASLGRLNTVTGDYAVAMGIMTKAQGYASTSTGYKTKATGSSSTAMGYGTTASGLRSTAIGDRNTASGAYSTALGSSIVASGSFSFGIGLSANSEPPEITWSNTMAIMGGKVGIGTTTPSYPLHVIGNFGFSGTLYEGTVPWSHISGFPGDITPDTIADDGMISDAEASDILTISNGLLYAPTSGGIGIGTTSPSGELEVVGDIVVSGTVDGVDIDVAIAELLMADAQLRADLDDEITARIVGDQDLQNLLNAEIEARMLADADLYSYVDVQDANTLSTAMSYTDSMVAELETEIDILAAEDALDFDSLEDLEAAVANGFNIGTLSGNIGIGTISPSEKLEVVGTVKATSFIGDGSGLTGLPENLWSQSGSDIYYIDGNVGIGTTNPDTKLEVAGPTFVTNSGVTGAFSTFVPSPLTDRNVFYIEAFDEDNSANKRTILLNPWGGNVGIGTTNPSQKLEVAGSISLNTGSKDGPQILLYDDTNVPWNIDNYGGHLRFFHHGYEAMTIDDQGRVGIGTSNPSKMLEVAGNVHVGDKLTWEEKTSYISVPGCAFRPYWGTDDEWIAGYSLKYTKEGYFTTFFAPLNLPHGAKITRVSFYWEDTNPNMDAKVQLARFAKGGLSEQLLSDWIYTSGSGGYGASNDFTIDYSTVDNNNFSYYLRLILPWDVVCHGLTIEYTITEPY